MAALDCTLYRPRHPQATPLYRLVQAHYTDVRDAWEEHDEGRYGFWRAFTDTAVGAYLDCGALDNGCARVRCGACRAEFLVAFSCKGRGLCPSCAATRALARARDPGAAVAFLRTEAPPDPPADLVYRLAHLEALSGHVERASPCLVPPILACEVVAAAGSLGL